MLATLAAAAWIAPVTLTVEGPGFLRFAQEGKVLYAKSAQLFARDGKLVHASGATLMPLVRTSADVEAVQIAPDGQVVLVSAGRPSQGPRLLLAAFPGQESSTPCDALICLNGRPRLGFPGESGFGTLKSSVVPSAVESQPGPASVPRPSTTALATVRAHPQGAREIDGDRMRLGDVAIVEGEGGLADALRGLDLGPAPFFGVTQKLTASAIQAKARQARLDLGRIEFAFSAPIEVRRRAQCVPQHRFVAVALADLESAGGQWAGKSGGPDFIAPSGELELKVEEVAVAGASASVRVAVYVNGKRVNSRTVRFEGTPAPLAVKAGAPVKVRFLSGGVVGEIAGRAKSGGAIGQNIEVTVAWDPTKPPTTHTARILDSGLVEVQLS